MAVTVNQIIQATDPRNRVAIPVAAATAILEGTIVFYSAAGFATNDDVGGTLKFAGIAVKSADNSAGAAGDIKVEVYQEGNFILTGSGFAQTDVGELVYATDNYTITMSSASATLIGRCIEFISATQHKVRLLTPTA